jgi:hypothetical protein
MTKSTRNPKTKSMRKTQIRCYRIEWLIINRTGDLPSYTRITRFYHSGQTIKEVKSIFPAVHGYHVHRSNQTEFRTITSEWQRELNRDHPLKSA